jgi:S1-C subfamily serine protease
MITLRMVAATLMLAVAAAGARADTEEKARIDLIRKVSNSVVRVTVGGTIERDSKDGKVTSLVQGGTGFVILHEGRPYIVTNHHVVSGPDGVAWKGKVRLVVGFNNQMDRQEVAVVGADELSDLAVLKFPDGSAAEKTAKPLALEFAKVESIEVGQTVLTVGYPHGQAGGPSIARGIISAAGRTVADGIFSDLIQTDAAVNHGNSGGPLVNLRGEVVGVNTYKSGADMKKRRIRVPEIVEEREALKLRGFTQHSVVTDVDPRVGINFARSAGSADPIVRLLIKNGRIDRPDLGFFSATLPWHHAAMVDLPEGVFITAVRKDGPATRATISPLLPIAESTLEGCLITGVRWENGRAKGQAVVKSQGDLFLALALVPPGSKLFLEAEKLNPKRRAIFAAAEKKGWLKGNNEAAPNIQDFLKLGIDGLLDKKVQIEYTLPAR